jgi:hypothetical protein
MHVLVHWTCHGTGLHHSNSNLTSTVPPAVAIRRSVCAIVSMCLCVDLPQHHLAAQQEPNHNSVLLAAPIRRLVCATLSTCLCTGPATAPAYNPPWQLTHTLSLLSLFAGWYVRPCCCSTAPPCCTPISTHYRVFPDVAIAGWCVRPYPCVCALDPPRHQPAITCRGTSLQPTIATHPHTFLDVSVCRLVCATLFLFHSTTLLLSNSNPLPRVS